MLCYKLTTSNNCTGPSFRYQWTPGEWTVLPPLQVPYPSLCTSSWLHAYEDPRLAIVMDRHHIDFLCEQGTLWLAEAGGEISIPDLSKLGATKMRLIRKLTIPGPYVNWRGILERAIVRVQRYLIKQDLSPPPYKIDVHGSPVHWLEDQHVIRYQLYSEFEKVLPLKAFARKEED